MVKGLRGTKKSKPNKDAMAQCTVSNGLVDDWGRLKKGQLKWMIIKSERDGDEAAPLITEASGDASSTHEDLWNTLIKVHNSPLNLLTTADRTQSSSLQSEILCNDE